MAAAVDPGMLKPGMHIRVSKFERLCRGLLFRCCVMGFILALPHGMYATAAGANATNATDSRYSSVMEPDDEEDFLIGVSITFGVVMFFGLIIWGKARFSVAMSLSSLFSSFSSSVIRGMLKKKHLDMTESITAKTPNPSLRGRRSASEKSRSSSGRASEKSRSSSGREGQGEEGRRFQSFQRTSSRSWISRTPSLKIIQEEQVAADVLKQVRRRRERDRQEVIPLHHKGGEEEGEEEAEAAALPGSPDRNHQFSPKLPPPTSVARQGPGTMQAGVPLLPPLLRPPAPAAPLAATSAATVQRGAAMFRSPPLLAALSVPSVPPPTALAIGHSSQGGRSLVAGTEQGRGALGGRAGRVVREEQEFSSF